ncbi:MAG: phage tail protein [Mogibacterium sp.]|nr:phage tail protein [Mogibacterium sp.]
MIPILFESGTTEFNTNGIGRLAQIIRCIAVEERNGVYEIEFDYPITGELFPELQVGRIVVCTHDEKGDEQPFIIYRRSIPDLRGVVTFNAHHISYMLNDIVVKPFTASSCIQALQGIKTNSANANPFNFWTDKSTTTSFKNDVPRNARNMLGGEENSILDVFGGGEYVFDKFDVRLYQNRGTDSGVEIYYGKNLINLNQDIDNSDTYNAIVPYWADTEGNVSMLPEIIISYAESGERVDAAPMDLSDAFETAPTAAQLRSAARSRYESGDSWLPTENLTVDFVQLWQTEEYKNFAPLQRVGLCDTVSVFYVDAGIENVKQKVVRVVYNVLLDRYDSMELGELQTSLGQAIRQNILETVPTTSMMEEAIQYATEMIRGGLGGYVVMTPGEHGYPQEILIMDTPDVNTAVNVWRFNRGGLGHSSSGYEGPYSDIALTADGRINASMITTGILNANLIRAGVLQDVNGNVTWNLATGVLNMTKGSINLGNGNFYVNDSGNLTAKTGKIGPFSLNADGLQYLTSYDYTGISEDALVTSHRVDWADDTSSVMGVSLSEGDLNFIGKIGGTNPKSYSKIYSFHLSQMNSGGSDYFVLRINRGSNTLVHIESSRTVVTVWGSISVSSGNIYTTGSCEIDKNLEVYGTKSRAVKTDNYTERLLYCYETPTPLFGDIGEAVLDEEGLCYVDIDDIFTETIAEMAEYQVFLQKEGEGDCWIAEKGPRYFTIQGTPRLKVAWELKAKQKDYNNIRLEQYKNGLEEYERITDNDLNLSEFIEEQEELLYGYN